MEIQGLLLNREIQRFGSVFVIETNHIISSKNVEYLRIIIYFMLSKSILKFSILKTQTFVWLRVTYIGKNKTK